MRNPKFKAIKANYRRRVLEVVLREKGKDSAYSLPFSAFHDLDIGTHNKFKRIEIDSELADQAVVFELEDGSKGDFPADLILYYCDPTYDWSPLNQLKRALREELKSAKISVRVMADALNTSPAQVMRLFEENKASKQLTQLFQLAELAGYKVEFQLKKKSVA